MPEDIQKQFKQYIAKVEVDDDEQTVTAIISTDIVDRDFEVMKPNGADLENYMKNPIVLWAHDYREPSIGKALWITKGRKAIKAKMKFADTPRAEEIYQLYKGGYLKAFSVGFIPKNNHPPEPKEIEKRPELAEAKNIIDEWELLEFSAVPVPANPEALATAVKTKEIAVSKGLQTELGIEDEETFYPASEEKQTYNCECIKCGHKITTEKHCKDIKCPKCGGRMRRVERPGPGQGGVDDVTTKPEETENYIRVPVRNCEVTATITISVKEGIKGLYCGKIKKVRTYLFDKAKGWTMAKAKAWVKEHDSGKDAEICNVLVENIPISVKSISSVPATVENAVPVKVSTDYEAKMNDAIKRKMGKLD